MVESEYQGLVAIIKAAHEFWIDIQSRSPKKEAEKPPQCVVFEKPTFDRMRALEMCSKCDLSIANVVETESAIYATQYAKDPALKYTCQEVDKGIKFIVEVS